MAVWLSQASVLFCSGNVKLILKRGAHKEIEPFPFEFRILDKIDDTTAFIGLSFAVRVVEALGSAAFLTAA
jgi:hypothetical protein